MMYFHYHPIFGLIYEFIQTNVLSLTALSEHTIKYSAKELLDMFFNRGILLRSPVADIEYEEPTTPIYCNLFDCNDFTGLYQKLEI